MGFVWLVAENHNRRFAGGIAVAGGSGLGCNFVGVPGYTPVYGCSGGVAGVAGCSGGCPMNPRLCFHQYKTDSLARTFWNRVVGRSGQLTIIIFFTLQGFPRHS